MEIKQHILEAVNEWLSPTFDTETQEAVKNLLSSSPKELKESFYKNLEFGTGGMRGIMGAGNNRINKYTLGKSTQGLSDYTDYVLLRLFIPLKIGTRVNIVQ
jgi:phosphoglucomutase